MNIERLDECDYVLRDICCGESFEVGGRIYMRAFPKNGSLIPTVDLSSGELFFEDGDLLVNPIDCCVREVN